MKYFNKLYKNIHCVKRNMSSFKLLLWEKTMFVNCFISMGKIEQKIMMITLSSPFNKSKRINLFRNPEDTIKVFVDRLTIKLCQTQPKVSDTEKLTRKCVLIKVEGNEVLHSSKCYEIFEEIKDNITLQINDYTYKVIVNAPLIKEFKFAYLPYEGLMFYPYTLDQRYNVSTADTQYLWFRIDSKGETEVGNKMTYIPTADDVNCCLKLVCSPFNDKGQPGPKAEITSSKVLKNTIQLYPFENRLTIKPINR